MGDFVHLHVHSEFSLRESTLRIEQAIEMARQEGMTAIAITDTNALYGVVPFVKQARAANIRPIIGVQLSVVYEQSQEMAEAVRLGRMRADSAVLLAMSWQGYQQLCQLVTLCRSRERHPFVTLAEIQERSGDLIALVGGSESQILSNFSQGQDALARRMLKAWTRVMPDGQLYVDVQDQGIATHRQGLPALIRDARDNNIPFVATNDVHYATRDDAETQRILARIDDPDGNRLLQGDRYNFAGVDEMYRRFQHLEEALHNTIVIAKRCHVEFPFNVLHLPKYPTEDGSPADKVLRRATEAGVKQRYGSILNDDIRNRMDYELKIIEQLGFADYFLVVADFIRFAHRQGISTGPGRGSAAASLVAYALRITDVDPVRNQLLFERFLNPERISWPDIDTDFEYERRHEVIQYVMEKYGRDHVAQIGTFGTLAARAAIRDAGRGLKIDAKLVDKVAKLIPSYPGVTLEHAVREVQPLEQFLSENAIARELFNAAQGLEGLPRHTSIHAAGVVISPEPLTQLVPVEPGPEGVSVTQFPMEDVEDIGLLKMDFLGLRTLTLIDGCVASIARRQNTKIDWRTVPEDDKKTFQMLGKGDATGCFQLESSGIRRVLRDLRPTNLNDLVAVISLYRPGPMENIPTFIGAKHGKTQVRYPHEDLKQILEETYGVIVYQEQIIRIASTMAGFSLGQADLLRRAVSKKKRDVLDQERGPFVEGCRQKGYSDNVANEVYDLIVRFADYGFNKAHAAAYAVLAYRTSYLRANYLADFLASLLTLTMGNGEKLKEYENDAKRHGIQILPPSVTKSESSYVVEEDSVLRTGLLSIRNVGRGAVAAIVQARDESPFTSLVDFLRRVNTRVCNRKAVESLLSEGAFVDFLPSGASGEVERKLLEEAYSEVEEQKQVVGLGLRFDRDEKSDTNELAASILYIRYDADKGGTELKRIQQVLSSYKGSTPVALYDRTSRKTRLLHERWSVDVTPDLLSLLEEIVGLGNAKLGQQNGPSR